MSGGRPVGTGKSADKVMAVLRGLGTDKEFRPIAIRTPELSQRTGITPNNLARVMNALVEAGQVTRCQVSQPGRGAPVNEYRMGAGMAHHVAPPLNPKRHGIAHGAPSKPLPVTRPAVQLSTPVAPATEIDVPVFIKQTTQAASPSATTPQEPAASSPAPDPDAGTGRHEPAARTIQPGSTLRLSIDQDGRLQIGDDADPAQIVFPPEHTLALGDFLALTQGVWRP